MLKEGCSLIKQHVVSAECPRHARPDTVILSKLMGNYHCYEALRKDSLQDADGE